MTSFPMTTPPTAVGDYLPLAIANAHDRDSHILFDEEPHQYYIHGTPGYTSVTTFVHMFFPHFDGEAVARKVVNNPQFPKASRYSKYRALVAAHPGASKDELVALVQQSWSDLGLEARTLGTALHLSIEHYYNGLPVSNDSVEYQTQFLPYAQMMEQKGYLPFRTEWRIYDQQQRICGSIDMIFSKKDPTTGEVTYHMVDWKRSKKITGWGFERGCSWGPCRNMFVANLVQYGLQLNSYKYILETNYGIKIASMELVVMHESYTEALVVPLEDREEDIRRMMHAHECMVLYDCQ